MGWVSYGETRTSVWRSWRRVTPARSGVPAPHHDRGDMQHQLVDETLVDCLREHIAAAHDHDVLVERAHAARCVESAGDAVGHEREVEVQPNPARRVVRHDDERRSPDIVRAP